MVENSAAHSVTARRTLVTVKCSRSAPETSAAKNAAPSSATAESTLASNVRGPSSSAADASTATASYKSCSTAAKTAAASAGTPAEIILDASIPTACSTSGGRSIVSGEEPAAPAAIYVSLTGTARPTVSAVAAEPAIDVECTIVTGETPAIPGLKIAGPIITESAATSHEEVAEPRRVGAAGVSSVATHATAAPTNAIAGITARTRVTAVRDIPH
jgi:hypothetical protein